MSCYNLTFWGFFRSLCPSLEDRPRTTQVGRKSCPCEVHFRCVPSAGHSLCFSRALPPRSGRWRARRRKQPLRELSGGTGSSLVILAVSWEPALAARGAPGAVRGLRGQTPRGCGASVARAELHLPAGCGARARPGRTGGGPGGSGSSGGSGRAVPAPARAGESGGARSRDGGSAVLGLGSSPAGCWRCLGGESSLSFPCSDGNPLFQAIPCAQACGRCSRKCQGFKECAAGAPAFLTMGIVQAWITQWVGCGLLVDFGNRKALICIPGGGANVAFPAAAWSQGCFSRVRSLISGTYQCLWEQQFYLAFLGNVARFPCLVRVSGFNYWHVNGFGLVYLLISKWGYEIEVLFIYG